MNFIHISLKTYFPLTLPKTKHFNKKISNKFFPTPNSKTEIFILFLKTRMQPCIRVQDWVCYTAAGQMSGGLYLCFRPAVSLRTPIMKYIFPTFYFFEIFTIPCNIQRCMKWVSNLLRFSPRKNLLHFHNNLYR